MSACPNAPNAQVRFDEGGVETGTMARPLRHRQTKGAETDTPGLTFTAPHSYSTVKTIACGNAGRFRCTRCYSCAFYQYKCTRGRGCNGHPAFPTPSDGRNDHAQLGRIARRDREGMFGIGADPVIPGRCEASNPESRDSPMRNCASEVWSCGPSRNDGSTTNCLWLF